jgi:hypothetical protein
MLMKSLQVRYEFIYFGHATVFSIRRRIRRRFDRGRPLEENMHWLDRRLKYGHYNKRQDRSSLDLGG